MTKATTHRNHQCQLLALFLVVLAASLPAEAFMSTVQGPFSIGTTSGIARNTACFMAKKKSKTRGGKGFGEAPTTTTSTNNNKSQQTSSEDEPFQAPIATKPQPKSQTGIQAAPASMSPGAQSSSSSSSSPSQDNDLNQGKAALEKMRRKRAEEKDAELRKVKEIRETDKMLQSSPDAAAIPEKVAMRMGKRMLPFVGIPLFGSMGVFVLFWYLATYKNMEFQPGLVATTTIVTLLSGLVGITYSIVSASWDEDREGSFLGVEEFQKNVASIREGLDRSKENMLLRERMAGLPEDEIEKAIADLEKRERREKSKDSFQAKLGEDMEN